MKREQHETFSKRVLFSINFELIKMFNLLIYVSYSINKQKLGVEHTSQEILLNNLFRPYIIAGSCVDLPVSILRTHICLWLVIKVQFEPW